MKLLALTLCFTAIFYGEPVLADPSEGTGSFTSGWGDKGK